MIICPPYTERPDTLVGVNVLVRLRTCITNGLRGGRAHRPTMREHTLRSVPTSVQETCEGEESFQGTPQHLNLFMMEYLLKMYGSLGERDVLLESYRSSVDSLLCFFSAF